MSGLKLELVVHPLCPYAQRALYANSFKNSPAELVLVSTANPPDWFLDLNPLGEVPALKVTKDGQIIKLTESLNISEYFDSFPGPHLYPRLDSGEVDSISKCLIDMFIKNKIGRLISAFYSLIMQSAFTPEEQKEIEEALKEFNDFVENGNSVMHKVLNKNEINFADVMVLPFVERILIILETAPDFVRNLDLGNLNLWYKNVGEQPWAVQQRAPPHQLKNLFNQAQTGGYQGLELPLSKYD